MSDTFSEYGLYYDLFYTDKDTDKEVEYIVSILSRLGIDQGCLLEFGSGTGRHASRLASFGYEVHGIEQSAEMIKMCQSTNLCTFHQGDIATKYMGKRYDAVLSLFHVVSYQQTNDKLNQVFHNARRHLVSNGLFIFDFWYSPAVLTIKPSVRVKRVLTEHVEVLRIAEPVSKDYSNIVDVNYTLFIRDSDKSAYRSFSESHSMRHFSIPELSLFAETNGFTLLSAEEWVSGRTPSAETWGVCVVCKKV